MQTKEELEQFYKNADPWEYQQNLWDQTRKDAILGMLRGHHFPNALDIGAGEGWITSRLPADKIYGIELSDTAAARFPPNVERIHQPDCAVTYGVVMTTGTLYPQYDHQRIYGWLMECYSKYLIIGGIKEWLIPYNIPGRLIHNFEFPYREYTQVLKMYKVK